MKTEQQIITWSLTCKAGVWKEQAKGRGRSCPIDLPIDGLFAIIIRVCLAKAEID
jgi:hypothetical protein